MNYIMNFKIPFQVRHYVRGCTDYYAEGCTTTLYCCQHNIKIIAHKQKLWEVTYHSP